MSEHVVAPVDCALSEASRVVDDIRADDAAFGEFYAAMLPRVYAFIRAQVADLSTAQELVSRIFVKAYLHRHRAPEGEGAKLWVFRIAHNTLIDHWRVDARRASVSVPLEELAALRDQTANPEEQYASKERQALLVGVIGDLPEDDRLLLSWKFAARRTNREIAAILSLSEGAVTMRLLRALRRLRTRLAELGLS